MDVGGDSTKQTVMVSNVDGAVELGVGLRLKFDSGLDSQRVVIEGVSARLCSMPIGRERDR
jgi:hypothetical protein